MKINNTHVYRLPEAYYTTVSEYAEGQKISRVAVLKRIKNKKLDTFRVGHRFLIILTK